MRLSLFASARRVPCSSAAIVAGSPAKPTTAFSTTSASGCAASSASASPSWPQQRAHFGSTSNSAACRASSAAFRPAASATTSYSPRWLRTTSSAWVPTEPVDPRIATFFTRPASSVHDVQCDVVRGGQGEDERVEAVHDPAVPRQDRTEVLDAEVALDHRFHEVAEGRHDRDDETEEQAVAETALLPAVDGLDDDHAHDHAGDHPADQSLDGLVRRDTRHERAAAHRGADEPADDVVRDDAQGDAEDVADTLRR